MNKVDKSMYQKYVFLRMLKTIDDCNYVKKDYVYDVITSEAEAEILLQALKIHDYTKHACTDEHCISSICTAQYYLYKMQELYKLIGVEKLSKKVVRMYLEVYKAFMNSFNAKAAGIRLTYKDTLF